MRRLIAMTVVTCLLVLASPSPVVSQQVLLRDVPQFDIHKEVRISGTVQEVKDYDCPISRTRGTHLALQTSQGTVEVHVAAARFLQEYGIRFNTGDKMEVIGTMGTYEGKPAFLPRIIMVGSSSYFVRDKDGKPLW
jgi:DNA/RNA endonuclease YhcR with UshA esterase domain